MDVTKPKLIDSVTHYPTITSKPRDNHSTSATVIITYTILPK